MEENDAIIQPFQHAPIDRDRPGFRLFRLQKGGIGRSLFGQLFTAYLDDRESIVPFEALSYTWGDKVLEDDITIDGKRLYITVNLSVALSYLRYEDRDRILWIDAICIDQTNTSERGHQVQQMGKIYSVAENVVFWLGVSTEETSILLESLQQLQRASLHRVPGNGRWAQLWSSLQPGLASRYPRLLKRQREGLLSLLERDWFTRVWIIQEVANARAAHVQCGAESVSARIFSTAPELLDFTPNRHCRAVLDIMPGPRRRDSWWSKSPCLYTLLKHFRGSKSREPRDRIYALVGMSSDPREKEFPADYTKPIPQLIRDVIKLLFRLDPGHQPSDQGIDEFLQSLESRNDSALRYHAKQSIFSSPEGFIDRLVARRDDAAIIHPVIDAARATGRIGAFLREFMFHPEDFPTRRKLPVDGIAEEEPDKSMFTADLVKELSSSEKPGQVLVNHLLQRREPKEMSAETMRLAVENGGGKALIDHIFHWIPNMEEAVIDRDTSNNLTGRNQQWAGVVMRMIEIASFLYPCGNRLSLDYFHHDMWKSSTYPGVAVSRAYIVQNPCEWWHVRWRYLTSPDSFCEDEASKHIPLKPYQQQRLQWNYIVNQVARNGGSERVIPRQLWTPIAFQVVKSARTLTARDWKHGAVGLDYLLEYQSRWVAGIQRLAEIAGDEKGKAISRLLAQQQRLWVPMMEETNRAGEERGEKRNQILELFYMQQRFWPCIIDELDRNVGDIKCGIRERSFQSLDRQSYFSILEALEMRESELRKGNLGGTDYPGR
ncbi:hypothetical protein CP533_6400 [Ophiocordyceps camponoti-saundersi (nom. inval.)]|nr:hypothetical protein CP533_6400 [Ophiocordyceps camponoti-saundersi (nom. inval.)]